MIKKLFFLAALLVSGVAFGANPTSNLSVQIVPAGSGPAVPAPAAAAGFTTPVVRADFTVPGNFWSNTANYITNCGAAGSVPQQPSTWHFNYRGWTAQSVMPCSDTATVTDPVYGGQVLDVKVTASEYSSTLPGGTYLSFPSIVTGGSVNTNWLPNELYTKIVIREDNNAFNQGRGIFGTYDWWSSTTVYHNQWLDIDVSEILGTGTSFCGGSSPSLYGQLNDWLNGVIHYSGTICDSTDPTQYHILEALTTSNESTELAFCIWFDGAFAGCKSLSLQTAATYILKDRSLYLSSGAGNNAITHDLQAYIKSIEVWSCTNYATQTCPGTIVDHWPFP